MVCKENEMEMILDDETRGSFSLNIKLSVANIVLCLLPAFIVFIIGLICSAHTTFIQAYGLFMIYVLLYLIWISSLCISIYSLVNKTYNHTKLAFTKFSSSIAVIALVIHSLILLSIFAHI